MLQICCFRHRISGLRFADAQMSKLGAGKIFLPTGYYEHHRIAISPKESSLNEERAGIVNESKPRIDRS